MEAVGIDLGTTFSVIAYIAKDGHPEAISNKYGETTTPSVIYLGSDPPIVGEEAKDLQAQDVVEIASFFKRSMGDPNFLLNFKGVDYTPTDLSALVLGKLKEYAEDYLGTVIEDAVITVPAYFNNLQREATVRAGKDAGLNVLRIIAEPTAAALAYGMHPGKDEKSVLVYDLGGGTFDVTIVQITADEIEVIATDGDHKLGGKDWDDRIFNYLTTKFYDEFSVELVGDEFNELLVQAERAKKNLSVRSTVNIPVQGKGQIGRYELTRELFEELTADLMERTQGFCEQVLDDAKMSWADLEGVLLVGGSTRMPMVREYVKQMSGKPPMSGVHPDEAVALGAAIQAQLDLENAAKAAPMFALPGRRQIKDVTSHSMGMIAISEDKSRYLNSIILKKNQSIPCSHTRPYRFYSGGRDSHLDVYLTQGESEAPIECVYLGKYVFSEFPETAAREMIIDITYAYDHNGIVNVNAVERSTKQPLLLTIEPVPSDVPDRFMLPPELEKEIAREHLTIYLAFDLSGSMSGQPLTEAKKAARAFVQQCDLSSTSIGLISFSDQTRVDLRACQNARQIGKAIDNLSIGVTGYGNATDPFNDVHRLLNNVAGLRYAIVLADGVWAYQDQAVRKAQKCHKTGIDVIAIGFGGADRRFLEQISSAEGLSIFTEMNQLTQTFSSIAQELTESSGQRSSGLGFLSDYRL